MGGARAAASTRAAGADGVRGDVARGVGGAEPRAAAAPNNILDRRRGMVYFNREDGKARRAEGRPIEGSRIPWKSTPPR